MRVFLLNSDFVVKKLGLKNIRVNIFKVKNLGLGLDYGLGSGLS